MNAPHVIGHEALTLARLWNLLTSDAPVELSPDALTRIQRCSDYLENRLQNSSQPIYGINTGFGALCNVKIAPEDLASLQENLVMSHACGTGEKAPPAVVKWMLLLKVQSLSYGYSGVQVATVQRLLDFYNQKALPVVYTQGSLGASGDLAPLAHLSLPLIGKGQVWFQGDVVEAEVALQALGWKPLRLGVKEGLALLNGTQFMSAYGVYILLQAYQLSYLADVIASLSLDAFDGLLEPFHPLLQRVRPHAGQRKTAQRISHFLEGSELARRPKNQVQDPYSLRCIPQVHGATKDTLDFVQKTISTEINGVTDNPTVFTEEDSILSGGNFHGQPLALALDYLGIALAELGSISERRTYQLLSGQRGLPEFLTPNPGLHSGLMIPQYTAAALVSQNKQLAVPASTDSLPSSNGQEDHVSMGANAATKALRILDNLKRILAIELLTAAQALEFRKPVKTSPFLEAFVREYRKSVSFVARDRMLYEDMEKSVAFLESYQVAPDLLFEDT